MVASAAGGTEGRLLSSSESNRIAVGQLWRGPYGVSYRVLAIWGDFVWTQVVYELSATQPSRPQTYRREMFAGLTLAPEPVAA